MNDQLTEKENEIKALQEEAASLRKENDSVKSEKEAELEAMK